MIKHQLKEGLKKVVEDLGYPPVDIVLSISSKPEFGDYSTNVALQLAKLKLGGVKQSPMEIAKKIESKLSLLANGQSPSKKYLEKIEIKKPGFLNFFIIPQFWKEDLEEILKKGEKFGKNEKGKGEKIQVEFISANPTGPLTLANGRGGALGDTLSNVLAWNGYQVEREYYVNDTGNQIRLLGESVLSAAGKLPPSKEHYQGDYIQELAEKFKDYLNLEPLELGHLLADYLLKQEIKPIIFRLGIKFDEYYSERSIYQRNLIKKTIELLKKKGLVYEKEEALWFKSTQFGDEKDRVLLTSEKMRGRMEPTYFLADLAHHLDVLSRGYKKRINFLGADHHSYGVRIQGALQALSYKEKQDIIFFQFVRLFKDNQEVRMSKRAGTYVALSELLDQVGADAIRFFFLMYAPSSHIDFNLDLAKEKSEKNPVFYVQYAYARMANILAKIKGRESHKLEVKSDFGILEKKEELELIKYLGEFPDLVEEIGQTYQVQGLPAYALKLGELLNKFYECCPVIAAESKELQKARIALVQASKIVLGSTLNLMGIKAPERM